MNTRKTLVGKQTSRQRKEIMRKKKEMGKGKGKRQGLRLKTLVESGKKMVSYLC